ncbi:hypothetical protein [Paucibacter sp. M5-1]|uniref:hypothetical protein n=1 Tax=Paucibacter sp. M5-1 TaxID=3015998 RepID=UPI0022B93E27|nr:hypothetical protein [Paucibacter sp. M5-1]MCZ7880232.1 hypothetical protein [Paucibacter sp. M5-1]
MNYASSPIRWLLQGPLLFTPQGWVVLASALTYWSWGAYVWITGQVPLFWKDASDALTLLLAWPFVVFLCYVRSSSPHSQASWWETFHLLLCVLALPVFALIRAW